MVVVSEKKGPVTLKAYRGDAKTLLAFNLDRGNIRKNLAGFTIQVTPPGGQPYYLHNNLRFETPGDHAQDPKEPAFSSINAPFHKFRWLHVPGQVHQGLQPAFGEYTYTVTPRHFDSNGSLQPLDRNLSAAVKVEVNKFVKGGLATGFTRGFTQSQAFVRHFGLKAPIKPKGAELTFDTSEESGVNATGEHFSFEQQYEWLGFTARERIFEVLDEVENDGNLSLDVFAYDLNEPDVIKRLVKLGRTKRVRVILDNAALHHTSDDSKPEDEFEAMFAKAAGKKNIKRGKFGRYAHDKVFIVSDDSGAKKVLTGSTNFSVTGLYVNSNHVLIFDDAEVAGVYASVFTEAWDDDVKTGAFAASEWATKSFSFGSGSVPKTSITFSPHKEDFAGEILNGIVERIADEGKKGTKTGSVLFAVMELGAASENPVYTALNQVHKRQDIFSYGISDAPEGISLFPIGQKTGVLVTGKPVGARLPPPFNQVPGIGAGHQIHHKFVVCGFNGDDPVVYCGSSNLALKGEQVNGDNLLAIHDEDVATVFAIEALALVDHFDFLDRVATGPKTRRGSRRAAAPEQPDAQPQHAAVSAGWFLGTDDKWAAKFFDPKDLHSVDRELFGS